MELNDRLKKIATGMSVADAIDSYMTQLRSEGDSLPDPEAERREELLAIIEVMFLMAAVDGEIADDEIQELRASVAAIQDMQTVEGIELDAVMDELAKKLERDGWAARLEAAAAKIKAPDARPFAFQLAAGVAFVDDFVAHAEAAAIDSLARALDLETSESQRLLREVHTTLFGA